MDGEQFSPPPSPPALPARRGSGFRRIAATAMLSAGLLAGSAIGGFVIAHAAGGSSTSASSSATSLTATTSTPPATKTPPATHTACPNMTGSGATSG